MEKVSIKTSNIEKSKGVVILPINEYQKLLAVPTFYLTGKEAEKLDKLVEKGLEEYKAGRTIDADSMTEALTKYEKKRKH